VNGDDLALHAVLDGLFAELLGFVFKAFVELVDVDVDHLVAGLGRFHDDVEGFVAAAVVAFVALRERADDVDEFSADVEPLAGFRMDHALEGLVGELDGQLVLIVFAGTQAGLDGAVFRLRVDVDEGREGGHALGDLVFKEHREAAVEVFFRGVALEGVEGVPFLLKRAGAAHLENVGAEGVGTVCMSVGVDPAAGGHDGRFDHVANRQGGVWRRH